MFTLLPLSRTLLHTCANCNSWETQTDGRHAYYMIITLHKLPLMRVKRVENHQKKGFKKFHELFCGKNGTLIPPMNYLQKLLIFQIIGFSRKNGQNYTNDDFLV